MFYKCYLTILLPHSGKLFVLLILFIARILWGWCNYFVILFCKDFIFYNTLHKTWNSSFISSTFDYPQPQIQLCNSGQIEKPILQQKIWLRITFFVKTCKDVDYKDRPTRNSNFATLMRVSVIRTWPKGISPRATGSMDWVLTWLLPTILGFSSPVLNPQPHFSGRSARLSKIKLVNAN